MANEVEDNAKEASKVEDTARKASEVEDTIKKARILLKYKTLSKRLVE